MLASIEVEELLKMKEVQRYQVKGPRRIGDPTAHRRVGASEIVACDTLLLPAHRL